MNSNILALVGSESGYDSIYPRNTMLIWDDIKEMYIAKVEFKSDIKTIKFSKQKLVNSKLSILIDTNSK